jgi:outer membrane protein assembly factor BamB
LDYGTGNQGYCYCIDTLGAYKWLYNIGGKPGRSTPCIVNGRVYFNSRSDVTTRGTFCIALSDGTWIWHEPSVPGTYDLGSNAPVTVNGGSVFTHYDYTPSVMPMDSFFSRSASTGARSWAYAGSAWSWSWSAAATDGSSVYAAVRATNPSQNGLYKLSVGGAYQGFYALVSQPDADCGPALSNGKLYVVDGNRVVCVNASSMSLVWSQTVTAAMGTPAVSGSVVYVGTSDGKLYALDAGTGAPLSGWPVTVGSSRVNTPSVAENAVFFGTDNGYFYAYDGTTGAQLYSYNCGAQIKDCPAISRGRVYVVTSGGKVFAFRHVPQTVVDVGTVSISAPSGNIDSGTVVIPVARVRNYGTQSATFNATLRIGAGYSQTRSKTLGVGAGAEDTVGFPSWTALRGSFTVKCTTALTGDQYPSNDTQTTTVTGIVHDAGATRILAPTGSIDSGTTVTPACSVHNYGNVSESYSVRMRIGTSYDEVAPASHAAGTRQYVTFPAWRPLARGAYAVTCSTELAGDMRTSNNRLAGSASVSVKDVRCTRIIVPAGVIDSGTTVVPACSVFNSGTAAATYQVRMKIGGAYNSTAAVSDHAPGTLAYVTFPNWTATVRWTNAVSCSTELSGDARPANDKKEGGVHVRVRDVTTLRVIAPLDTVDSGAVVTPAAVVANLGTIPEYFAVTLRIPAIGYTHAVPETLLPSAADTLAFSPCTLNVVGHVAVRCSSGAAGDMVPANNVATGTVYVRPWTAVSEGEAVAGLPIQPGLRSIAPNPTSGSVGVRYAVGSRGRATLAVYDIDGREVCALVDDILDAGVHYVRWNGRDEHGRVAPAGVYFCRLRAGEFAATRKLLKVE